MGIFGLGTDIVRVSRIARILASPGISTRFCRKVLHLKEMDQFQLKPSKQAKAQFVASRWAAKEACVKASGDKTLIFSQILISKEQSGRPYLEWEERNRRKLEELGVKRGLVSMSHEEDFAIATVILED